MGTARDRLNQIRGKKSENITARDRLNQLRERPKQREKIGFDTLAKDMASVGKTVNSVYGGWQDPTTMASGKKEVQGIYDRLSALQDYQNKYGVDVPGRIAVKPGTTMEDVGVTSPFGFKNYANASPRLVTDVANKEFAKNYTKQQKANTYQAKSAYKSILDDWDKLTELYGGFETADAFSNQQKQWQLSDKFKGFSYDDVQNEKKKYSPDSDEYKFLDFYTEYTNLNDFDKAMSGGKISQEVLDTVANYERNIEQYSAQRYEYGSRGYVPSQEKADPEKAKELEKNMLLYLKSVGFNSYDEFKKARDEQNAYFDKLETARNLRKLEYGTMDYYADVMQNPDFAEKSKYVTTKKDSPLFQNYPLVLDAYDDITYEYINNIDGKRDRITSEYKQTHGAATSPTEEKNSYDKLNPDEIAVYNYIYATEGKDKAQEFLDSMQVTLSKRTYDIDTGRWKNDSQGVVGGTISSLLSIPANLIGTVGGMIEGGIELATGAEYNPYAARRKLSNYATDTRQYVGENIAEATEGFELFGQNIPSFLYQTGMSMADTAFGAATLGTAYTPFMGYNAAQQTAKELIEKGESSDVVFQTALVSGVAEALFEYVSIDKLLKIGDIDSKRAIISSALKQAGIEATEEMATEITNIFADIGIRGDSSEFVEKYNDLIARGYTEEEARTEVAKEIGSRVAWAGVGGGLSGAGMGGGQSVGNYLTNKSTGASIRANERTGDVFDVVQNMTPEESSAYEAYTRYAKKGITADNITDAKLGNLHRMATMDSVKASLSETSTDKQRAEAENRLYRLGKAMEKNNASEKKRNAEATTEQGTSNAEKYTVDDTTQITSTGKSVKIEGIKVDGDKINVVTNDGEISADDMTFTSTDRAILGNAEQIAREYSNDLANVFISQYDGKTDTEAYANAFNLMTEYTKNNVTESVMLENRGPLTTEQVKAIYNAAVHQQFVAQENAIKTYTEKQGKNNVVKGTFDDSIIDYNGTTTDGSKVNWKRLSDRQKKAVNFARMFSKATGVNIRFIQSKVEGGKRVGKNGSYDPDTNTIEIDVYAGIVNAESINDSIIPTLSHEITHWMKNKAPALYDTFRNEIMNSLVASRITKDVAVRKTSEDLIEDELARLREKHPDEEWTEEDAIDEIVARACEDMLRNSDAARKLIGKLKPTEQKKFIAKLKETVKNLLEWVNNLLKEYASNSDEARLLSEYKENLKKLSKMWDEMLVNAVKNNQALQNEGVIGETLVNGISKDGTTIEGKNTLQMSDRTYREGGREFLINWLDGHRGLTEADKQDIIDQTDRIAELMRAIENEEELPDYSNWANMEVVKDENGEKVLSVIVKNGDYAMNIDFSQVCKKRVALNAVLNAMVQSGDLNVYTLTETDVADLNAIIKSHEFEIACALCFVDSKRYRVGNWAKSFCEGAEKKKNGKMVHQYGFNEMVRSLVPKGSNIKIDEYNFTGRDIENQPTKNLLSEADDSELDFTLIDEIMKIESKPDGKSTDLYAYAKAIKDNKSLRKILNPAEIISSIGLDAIRLEEPELYRLINRHQGTARPKFSHDIVAYGNDILKAKGFSAEKAKMVGGVRCQSFSDFMANMVIDYAQFVSELSAKELTCHTYTKEPLFVKLFGLTGIKINMSLVPKAIDMTPEQQKQFAILKDKNANKRSAEYKEAMKQYEKLAKNAGLDENGNYIWEDETFPYDVAMELVTDSRYSANCGTIAVGISDNHIRKLLADPMISMVIPYHKSGLNHDVAMMRDIALYKDYTKAQSTRYSNGQKLKGAPDFDFYGDLYGVDGKEGTHDPKKTAENYLEWCKEHKYLPKFNAFASDPNYYKLLVDFRVYDTDGTYREQQPVRPIYPSNEEFKDLILNGVKDKNGKVYGGLKQQQGNTDRLSAESQQIIDEYREVLKDKYGKDVLKKQYSEREIIGESGKNYGMGVYLDDDTLTPLTDEERKKEIEKIVTTKLAGKTFIAYDNDNHAVDVRIARKTEFIRNKKGKRRYILNELYEKNNNLKVKQEAILLVDELFANAKYDTSGHPKHPHGWLDNNGNNDYDYWKVYVQEKNKAVWEAILLIANTSNGEKILYDINPIKMVEGSGKESVQTSTDNNIPQTSKIVKKQNSDRDSEGNTLSDEQIEFFKDSKVRDDNGSLLVCYHGTNAEFNSFNVDFISSDNKLGFGFYFMAGKKLQFQYEHPKTVYLNIMKPITDTSTVLSKERVEAFCNKLGIDYKYDSTDTDLDVYVNLSYSYSGPTKTFLQNAIRVLGVDGVISAERNVAVAFEPSQIKNIDNTNPTSNPDIRYSDRQESIPTEELYDLMGENEKLKKRVEILTADIERWKERLKMEGKETNGQYFRDSTLEKIAAHIRKKYNSNIDKARLTRMLCDVTQTIHSLDSSGMTSDQLLRESLLPVAYAIAEQVATKDIIDEEANSILKAIRGEEIVVSENQIADLKYIYGDNWHNAFFGKLNVRKGKNGNVDEVYARLREDYPSVFPDAVSDGDMLPNILDAYNRLKDAMYIEQNFNVHEAAMEIAREVYEQTWNLAPTRTIADKYADKIKALKTEHNKAMSELRQTYEDRAEKQKLADDKRYGRIIDNIRKRDEMALDLAKKKGKEKLDKYKENAERKTRLQRITANVLALSRKLIKNSKDEHIPEIMKPVIVELVQALDFSSKRMLDKGIPTQKDISLYKALERVQKMMLNATRGVEGMHDFAGHGLDDQIELLVSAAFNTMRDFGDNEFILNNMSLEDLATLDETVRFIKYVVNTVNKFYVAKHSQGVANLSKESVSEMRELGDAKKFGPKSLVGGAVKLLNWKNINPLYAFKRFGEGGKKIFEALQDGWDKFAFNIKTIIDFAEGVYTDEEVKAWGEKIETFELTEPVSDAEKEDPDYKPKKVKVRMTVAQIMSLYCLNKREQARGHLLGGGIRVADFEDGRKTVSQTDAVILTDKTIAEIIGRLDKRQIEVADKLQKFLSEDCAKWGNEVSMLRFGYNAFGELNYFPIQSDENNLAVNDATDNQNSLFRLLNMSFSKSLTDNANNAIVISDIFDVFAQHSSDMAKYNALALPVLDAFRWYNYVEKQQKGEIEGNTPHKTMSVKEAMEKAFGNDAKEYFITFLRDINGTQNVSRDTLGGGFFKNAKIAAVGANLRVVLLQPTSYLRASAVIDGKYLSRALMHKPKIADAIKHCGIALWKSLGYYDTNVQKSVEEQIKHAQTKKDKAIEWAMKGAEVADKITWGYLWNACELEIRDKRKDLEVGSKEFYEAIGKRLREVIYATQVVDSTMTRSEMMRSSDRWDKVLTAFASEPTLAYNMLYDAYMNYHLDARKYGKAEAAKKNGRKIARVIMAYTVTNMVAALVESGFDAFRDDEENKDLVYFMKLYFTNLASDMSITGKIPYVKEFHSILKGFSSSRTDTQWMESTIKAMKEWYKIFNREGDSAKLIKNSIKAFSDFTGLPFYNVYRDLSAGINLLTDEDLDEMFNDFFD